MLVLILIIAVVYLLMRKKATEDSSKGSLENISVKPIDNRFGQLDSTLQLQLPIANPSYQSLDQEMMEQNKADQVKSESGSDSAKKPINRNKDK